MKKKITTWLRKRRIALIHRLMAEELKIHGWTPDATEAGRWEKTESHYIAGKPQHGFKTNMAYHEAVSKILKTLPR